MPQYSMDAKCPECERVAVLDDDVTSVKCPHCNFCLLYTSPSPRD